MPKVQRKDIPRALFAHLLLRIEQRSISADALKSLAAWLDTNPEVPTGDWYKLTITGYDNKGAATGSTEVYLADYRDSDDHDALYVADLPNAEDASPRGTTLTASGRPFT